MKNPGIYILTNTVNGKQYVGMDSNLPARSLRHLNGHAQKCPAIHNAILKHGAEVFDVELIPYPHISWQLLCIFEKSYIAELDTYHNGYNRTLGGDGSKGHKLTDEAKEKRSQNQQGKNNPFFGKKHTTKSKRLMSKNNAMYKPENKGENHHSHSEKWKQKLSKAMSGDNNPAKRPEVKAKMSETKRRRRQKVFWVYIRSLARVWYESNDYVVKRRLEIFDKSTPDTSTAKQETLF